MNLKKSIIKVFSANFLQLISSLIVGFFVPAILRIDDYARLKTYTLYVSYIGFFHLGYIDGLYIKYGGKKNDNINKGILKGEHTFLIIFQLIISLILFVLSVCMRNIVLLLFSISILPIMLQAFHKYINQAIGNFDSYSKIMYIYTIVYLVLNILLALILRNKNYILYCFSTFCANLVSVVFFEIKFLNEYKNEKSIIDKKNIINIIKTGFFVMLGNLAVVGLFGIDKWFVKLFLTTEDFAYYSFAVSMLNIINTLVSAISITFYNYLFENSSIEKINKLKKYLITLGGFASAAYFVLSFIVNYFLKKYIPSLNIIAITFAIFPYMILINALYINLYKVNKDEKHYFKVVVSILVISIIYNIIAVLFFHNAIAIAFATIITLITWVIYSTIDLKNIMADKKMYTYMIGLTVIFLTVTHFFNWLVGGIVYLIAFFIWTVILNKEVITEVNANILKIIKSKMKKQHL